MLFIKATNKAEGYPASTIFMLFFEWEGKKIRFFILRNWEVLQYVIVCLLPLFRFNLGGWVFMKITYLLEYDCEIRFNCNNFRYLLKKDLFTLANYSSNLYQTSTKSSVTSEWLICGCSACSIEGVSFAFENRERGLSSGTST